MSPKCCFRAALVALLATQACSEESAVAVPVVSPEAVRDLVLSFPAVTDGTLLRSEIVEVDPPNGPVRVPSEEEEGSEDPASYADEVSRIISPITQVGFATGYAYSRGRHSYTGNVGEVTTTATVSFEGEVIGTMPASRRQTVPFLTDFGQVKTIFAEAWVFTDQECGLKVEGASEHRAAWQWFLGGNVPNWGQSNETTQGFPPAEQPPCEEPEEEPEPAYETEVTELDEFGEIGEGESMSCWFLLTYDTWTGQVLYVDLLYCEEL